MSVDFDWEAHAMYGYNHSLILCLGCKRAVLQLLAQHLAAKQKVGQQQARGHVAVPQS